MSTRKYVPERTCIVCREVRPKGELVRLVHTPKGEVEIDEKGKKAGRGAYLCKTKACWQKALADDRKNRLARALKVEITSEGRTALSEYGNAFP